jgi:probable HAF family extracellular repeat protein
VLVIPQSATALPINLNLFGITKTELPALPSQTHLSSSAIGVNARGDVLGDSGAQAVVWQSGTPVDLGRGQPNAFFNNRAEVPLVSMESLPDNRLAVRSRLASPAGSVPILPDYPGYVVQASSNNNRGQVLVATSKTFNPMVPTALDQLGVWQQDGQFTRLMLPDTGELWFAGGVINDQGTVAGNYLRPSSQEFRSFVCNRGVCSLLSTPGRAGVLAINDLGLVVGLAETPSGTHAMRWTGTQPTDLGTLGGASSAPGNRHSINVFGHVVGVSATANGDDHAFLWRNGQMTDLGTLGGKTSRAAAINDWGDVVGTSQTADGKEHAFLWRNGRMTDLGTLGGDYSVASDINNNRQIVGVSGTPAGVQRGLLWTAGLL